MNSIPHLDPCISLDTPQPSVEDYEHIRMEYLQRNSDTVDGRKDDNAVERNFEQSLTGKIKNSSVLSTGNQKELSHLQEGQRIKANRN